MRIAIYSNGAVVLTTPRNFTKRIGRRFILEKTKWILSKLDLFKQFEGREFAQESTARYLKDKENARKLVHDKINYYASKYGCRYNKISIKNQKTCWGSCSRKANLNFNYKILFLPEDIQNYIVIHELCHLIEFNHSRRFWALVEREAPNYIRTKKELRLKGILLNSLHQSISSTRPPQVKLLAPNPSPVNGL